MSRGGIDAVVTIVARTRILEAYGHQLSLDPDHARARSTVALLFSLDEETVREVAALMFTPPPIPTTSGGTNS